MVDFLLNSVLPFSLLSGLDSLKPINLDHEILLLLLLDVPLTDLFFLQQLLVSDSNNLGIHNHFIHFFNIVSILIPQIISLLNHLLLHFSLLFFLLRQRHVFLFSLGDSEHSLLFCDGGSELLLLLLFEDSLLLKSLFLGQDDGLILFGGENKLEIWFGKR